MALLTFRMSQDWRLRLQRQRAGDRRPFESKDSIFTPVEKCCSQVVWSGTQWGGKQQAGEDAARDVPGTNASFWSNLFHRSGGSKGHHQQLIQDLIHFWKRDYVLWHLSQRMARLNKPGGSFLCHFPLRLLPICLFIPCLKLFQKLEHWFFSLFLIISWQRY